MKRVEVKAGTRLDQLLKYVNIVSTGGEAKYLIQSGQVKVDNKVEKRRGYKLKEGDLVETDTVSLKVSIKD